MEMAQFYDLLEKELAPQLPEGMSMVFTHVRKNNNVIEDGISFTAKGSNISPNIYLSPYLEAYENGRTITDIAKQILHVLKVSVPKADFEVNEFLDYEKVKTRIAYKLINAEKNSELLNLIPYTQYMDLAMVFYYILPPGRIKDEHATILIHKTHLDIWKITAEQLKEDALANTPRLLPVDIINMNDVLQRLMGDAGFMPEFAQQEIPMYVMSNTIRQNGAATMAYPGVLDDFAGSIGKNLYIIPSSIHEVILVPESQQPYCFNTMVREVNSMELDPKEVLADHVYYYDRSDRRIVSVLREESSYC